IPDETTESEIVLNLFMRDTKHELDRLNIWVNDVAIKGTEGIDLRELNIRQHELSVAVPLARGKNKIEVGVLNKTGAESYKKTVSIISEAGKERADLYIVSLGVSKHQNEKYNLEYADKDAKD